MNDTYTQTAIDERSWWARPFAVYQSNIRETDANLDTDASVRMITEAGFDSWLLNAGGIVSFYPSDDDQPRAPLLSSRPSGDLIADAVTSAHTKDVRLIARFDFSRLPDRVVDAHPEWAHISPSGERVSANGLTNLCPRSDYHRVRVPQILADFVQRYEIDGIFLNWHNFVELGYHGEYYGPCQCDRCRRAFSLEFPDQALPAGRDSKGYLSWRKSARRHLDELAAVYHGDIRDARHDVCFFTANAHFDMAFLEINSFGSFSSGHWWEHLPSEIASSHVVAHPETPALTHAAINLGLPQRLISEQPAQAVRYLAQGLSRGSFPAIAVIGRPRTDHLSATTAISDVVSFFSAHRDLYNELRPAAAVGVFRPGRGTATAALLDGTNFDEFRGVYESLQQTHVPFDVLGTEFADDLIDRGTLGRYRVLVAPGGLPAGTPLASAVAAFVEAGGHLLTTGDPAWLDSWGSVGEVERILEGAHELGGRFGAPSDGAYGDMLPLTGVFWGIRAGRCTRPSDWELSERAPFGPPEITHGNEASTGFPLVLSRTVRQGELSALPWSIGTSKRAFGVTSLSDFLAAEARALLGEHDTITAELPSAAEITVMRAGRSTVVHIVNSSGGRQDRIDSPIPMTGDIVLRHESAASVTRARSLLTGAELPLNTGADGTVRVPVRVDAFEVVQLN